MGHKELSIVLAGGGTAGHVNPLLAVADALQEVSPNIRITVVGTHEGLEADLVPRAGYSLFTIDKVPFPRRPNGAALAFPWRWHRNVKRLTAMLRDVQADVVVGFGGYASAPTYRAAQRCSIPIVIHEQNAVAGMANKLGARWAEYIGTAYDATTLQGKKSVGHRVGLPLRPAIARLAKTLDCDHNMRVRELAAHALGLDPQRPIIVVTGGSLGAQHINDTMAHAAAECLDHAQILHLTGRGKMQDVISAVNATSSCSDTAISQGYSQLVHATELVVDYDAIVHFDTYLSTHNLVQEACNLDEQDDAVSHRMVDVVQVLEESQGTIATDQVSDAPCYDSSTADPSHSYYVAEYLERIDVAFACADLVVCRSGAGTVSELTALGIPAIYVPLPIGNGEQRYNALPIVEQGGAELVADADFTPQYVVQKVLPLLQNCEQLQRMAHITWEYGIRDAAQRMAQAIIQIANKR